MYICGVSTRKVAKITEQMCGFDISSAQVGRAAAKLDELLKEWRNQPLGCFPYVYLDAMYETGVYRISVPDSVQGFAWLVLSVANL